MGVQADLLALKQPKYYFCLMVLKKTKQTATSPFFNESMGNIRGTYRGRENEVVIFQCN